MKDERLQQKKKVFQCDEMRAKIIKINFSYFQVDGVVGYFMSILMNSSFFRL